MSMFLAQYAPEPTWRALSATAQAQAVHFAWAQRLLTPGPAFLSSHFECSEVQPFHLMVGGTGGAS